MLGSPHNRRAVESLSRPRRAHAAGCFARLLARAEQHASRDVRYELALDVTRATRRRVARTSVSTFRACRRDPRFPRPAIRRAAGEWSELVGSSFNSTTSDPSDVPRGGERTSRPRLRARIAPSGASIIRLHDPRTAPDYLYTLLVPADAQQLFPCFDQPDLKARVSLTLTTPAGWRASRTGRGCERTRRRAAARSRFARRADQHVPHCVRCGSVGREERRRRRDRSPLRARLARRGSGTRLDRPRQRASADWLERYFDSRFPFQKLDLVLAPAFPFGGMEHPARSSTVRSGSSFASGQR